jgi:hypothetical protein
MRQMLIEFGFLHEDATPIVEDNHACIFMTTTAITSNMTKHMDIHFYFVRDAYQRGMVKIYSVSNKEMIVGIFTKSIVNPKFEKFVLDVMRCFLEYFSWISVPVSSSIKGRVEVHE